MQRRALILLFILALPLPSEAQIATAEGVTLSPFPVLQTPASYPSFPDVAGGLWSVFVGAYPGSGLYAQHIREDGSFASPCTEAAWRLTESGTQVNGLSAGGDGLGGAVLTWFGVTPTDSLSPFIALRYLHIDASGEIPAAMPDTGIVVSNIASAALVVNDGAGGAYVVWEELKGASNPDIYAQHYGSSGQRLWTPTGSPSGVPVCGVVGIQRLRALHSDGAGGAYAVWADMRAANSAPLYVAHLEPTGVSGGSWTTNGVRVTPITPGIRIVASSPAPSGGLWLAWRDIGVASQVSGQHIAVNGAFRWAANGAILATVTPLRADFVPGSNGQAFFTWGGSDIRCQKLDTTGVRLWNTENTGRILVDSPWGSLTCRASSDGAGGQWLAWGRDNAGQSDVHVLRVNGAGAPWPDQDPNGDAFTATPANEEPVAWFHSMGGEPAIAWLEEGVLKARRLPLATLGVDASFDPAGVALSPPSPHPLRGQWFTLRFTAPTGPTRAELFDVNGRRVAVREIWSAGGVQSVRWDEASRVPPGVYALRLTASGRVASRRVVSLR